MNIVIDQIENGFVITFHIGQTSRVWYCKALSECHHLIERAVEEWDKTRRA